MNNFDFTKPSSYFDVQIDITNDDGVTKSLYYSKFALMLYSDYFCAMFSNNMVENITSVIKIDNLDYDSFLLLIGKINNILLSTLLINLDDNFYKVVEMADRFIVNKLKHVCDEHVCFKLKTLRADLLDLENSTDAINAVYNFNLEKTYDFIKSNNKLIVESIIGNISTIKVNKFKNLPDEFMTMVTDYIDQKISLVDTSKYSSSSDKRLFLVKKMLDAVIIKQTD